MISCLICPRRINTIKGCPSKEHPLTFKYKYTCRRIPKSLKYDFYKGTRRMKLLDSNEISQLRDVCIFEVNDMEMYM